MSREVPAILETSKIPLEKQSVSRICNYYASGRILKTVQLTLLLFLFKDLRAFQKHATINGTTKARR